MTTTVVAPAVDTGGVGTVPAERVLTDTLYTQAAQSAAGTADAVEAMSASLQAPVFGKSEDSQRRSGDYDPAQLLRDRQIDKVATADLVAYLESPGMQDMLQRAVKEKQPMEIDVVSIMRKLYTRLKPETPESKGVGGEGVEDQIPNTAGSKLYSYPGDVASERRPVIKTTPVGGEDALVLATENRPFHMVVMSADSNCVRLIRLPGKKEQPTLWDNLIGDKPWIEVQEPEKVRKPA